MMDGRVKTLHPKVHGGILARRADPAHMAAAAAHGIGLIDLVVVNLYPFAKAAANPATPFDGLVEEIDIGGPSLVRGAAKNFADVLVVVDRRPTIRRCSTELDRPGGPSRVVPLRPGAQGLRPHRPATTRRSPSTLGDVSVDDGVFTRSGRAWRPARARRWCCDKLRDLRYGENPHQAAAWYAESPRTALGGAVVLQGKELSYTNLLDLDAAARIVLEFAEPAAAVIKHTNPCGAATGASAADAYVRAREADALSAFGGIVGAQSRRSTSTPRSAIASTLHRRGDRARRSTRRRCADPGQEGAACASSTADFSRWRRGSRLELRSILGAVLAQQRDRVVEAAEPWPTADLRVVTQARSRRRRSGRRCASPGASARTSSRTP